MAGSGRPRGFRILTAATVVTLVLAPVPLAGMACWPSVVARRSSDQSWRAGRAGMERQSTGQRGQRLLQVAWGALRGLLQAYGLPGLVKPASWSVRHGRGYRFNVDADTLDWTEFRQRLAAGLRGARPRLQRRREHWFTISDAALASL